MSDQPIYRPGRLIAGRYRVTSALSQGGMGAVYLAQQVSLGRDVALKVILERGSDPDLLKRFDVEARAVCQLKHHNIITYHDYGRDEDGHPFLVMEFLSGYPGTKLVHGDRQPTVADLVHVISQICEALDEAHRKGIIHRDLKWSNVMICPQARDPYFAKLIDFGIMKVATDGSSGDQRGMTRTGMLLGTPEYMSPEAICGMPIDGRADQYSLAIMLWEALEGRRPFDSPSQFELLRMQVQDPPPPLMRGASVLDDHPGLALVLERALEKHPDDRFASIVEFQKALLAAMEDHAVATAKARPAARKLVAPAPVRPGTQPELVSRRSRHDAPRSVDTHHRQAAAPARKPRTVWLVGGAFVVSAALVAVLMMVLKADEPTEPVAVVVATQGEVPVVAEPDVVTPDVAPAEPDVAVAQIEPDVAVAPAEPDVAATQPPAQVVDVREDTRTEPKKNTATKVTSQATEPGRLTLVAEPWAYVSVAGGPAAETPAVYDLKPGRYTVTVKRPDVYRGVHTFSVIIKSGETTHRRLTLGSLLQAIE